MASKAKTAPAVGQMWADEDGKKWKIRVFSKRGWPVVTRFGYRTAAGIETNPAWFDHWTLLDEESEATDAPS
jgi:hypothetical protein